MGAQKGPSHISSTCKSSRTVPTKQTWDASDVITEGKFWQISAAINFSLFPSSLALPFKHRFVSAFPIFPYCLGKRKEIAMNRKMSAVSNTHTKITAIERVILNKETID